MHSHYPLMVNITAEKQVKVDNPTDHEKRYPGDFKRFMALLEGHPGQDGVLTDAASVEREACAQLAENFVRGNKIGMGIAEKIRARGTAAPVVPEIGSRPPVELAKSAEAAAKPETKIETGEEIRLRVEAAKRKEQEEKGQAQQRVPEPKTATVIPADQQGQQS